MDNVNNNTNTEMCGRHYIGFKAEYVKVFECLSQNIFSLTQELILPAFTHYPTSYCLYI